jgi:type I restriction enzyme S subunit
MKVKISDICSRFSSGSFIKARDVHSYGKYPVYGGNGVRGYTDTYNFSGKCVIIGRVGAYCGNVHYFEGKAFITDNAIIVQADKKNSTGWLGYKLKTMNLKQFQGQSAQPVLSTKTLLDLEISVPPLKEQVKIFNHLNNIDTKIANNNAISKELESMAKTIYDYWFLQFEFPDKDGKPYKSNGGKMVWNDQLKQEIPEGWNYLSLRGNYSLDKGVSYSSKDLVKHSNVGMINLKSITKQNEYRPSGLKFLRNLSESKRLKPFDMLIACTDLTREADIIGTPILVPEDSMNYTYSMDIAKIGSTNPNILDSFLYQYMRTNFYHKYIKRWASGTNVLHLNTSGLDWLGVIVPPLELQKKYDSIFKEYQRQKSLTLKENRQLHSLRDFLLPMLMNEQVTIEN